MLAEEINRIGPQPLQRLLGQQSGPAQPDRQLAALLAGNLAHPAFGQAGEFSRGDLPPDRKKHHDRLFNHWESYFEDVKAGPSADDRRIPSQPEVEESFRQRRESYAQGPGCLLQEVQALYSDPRIDLAHLAACTVPITHGIDDKVVPVEVARDLHARIPGSGFQELPRRGIILCTSRMTWRIYWRRC